MRTKNLAILVALGALTLSSCSSMQKGSSSTAGVQNPNAPTGAISQQQPSVPPEILSRYTSGWPDSSVSAAKKVLTKYGEPTESTPSMLVWKDIAPFRRIVVYREEVMHRFPLLHKDVVENVVAYKIPIEKAGELAKFDGSVNFDRTRGELSARSDDEAMNLVALNLASDIISGKRDANNARLVYGKVAVDFINGNRSVLTQGLQFVGQSNTADADQSTKFNFAQSQEAQPVINRGTNPTQLPKTGNLKQAQEQLTE